MARKINYIIGNAEELTRITPPPRINPPGAPLYNLQEVVKRLAPQFDKVASELNALPDELCPRDFTVSAITLHPSYIAKGHFPRALFREMGVHSIGSKGTEVLPDKWTRKGEPQKSPTTKIFIAGKRDRLTEFGRHLTEIDNEAPGAEDLLRVWSIDTVNVDEKIKEGLHETNGYYEVGLQLIPGSSSEFVKTAFLSYAQKLGFDAKSDLAIEVSNLWFMPLIGSASLIKDLAKFSFVRVIRPLPLLRSFRPIIRSLPARTEVSLPNVQPHASDIRVAILDGGLPTQHVLKPWVNNYHISDPTAHDCLDGPSHGLGVTSAFLFGPLWPGETAQRPFSYVDHHRVLDSKVQDEDPLELYRTLTHIEDILLSRQYEFLNISLGPDLPIDDDEIHPWTSLLDTYLADGDTFVTIAAGNNGEHDLKTGLCRIQVPSDSVNALAVGAADNIDESWGRASYSAIGPGRAPGRVKPDLLAFGGTAKKYFHVPSEGVPAQLLPICGTSFSAPYLLRKAVGIRAILGHNISPLAIKALLIHAADQSVHEIDEVGWGKVPENIGQIIESPEGVARILYQGELLPGKYMKVPLPIPDTGIAGKVKITATCCFATPVDPQDTSMYTKAGVEITWRPKPGKSESFFKQKKVATEAELRSDAGKWESALHAKLQKLGSSLENPSFEIHYIARNGGGNIDGNKAPIIKYAFIVSIEAPKHPDIFNEILRAYSSILSEIQPRISTPIEVSV
jgi:hypothetical protein